MLANVLESHNRPTLFKGRLSHKKDFFKLILVMFSPIFLLFHLLWCTTATDYVVYPTTYSSSNRSLYLTLSDYVRDTNKFFASDSQFSFLNGEHHLRTELHLISLTNITLIGTRRSVEHWTRALTALG